MGDDRSGEEIVADQLSALYAQLGVEMASDDVSGAWLDPTLVRDGRAVEMKFFKDMAFTSVCRDPSRRRHGARSSEPSGTT